MPAAPPVRWRQRVEDDRPAQPATRRAAAWTTAPALRTTVLPASAMVPGAELARELVAGDVWLASAGHVELDGPAAPHGRVEGLATPVRGRRRKRRAAEPAPARQRAGTSRGLPEPVLRRVTVLGAPRRGGEAPPLRTLDLPAGVVPDFGPVAPVVVAVPEDPEPMPVAQPLPHRRVVRRVGLGAPLPVPPPRVTSFEPEPYAAPTPVYEPEPAASVDPQQLRTFPRRRLESVPDEVRRAVEAATGIALGDVPVVRGQETSQIARALRAKAFTVGGEVHLPAEHGPLSDPRARALLAHELVHVAQQRRLGDALPPENSLYGQLLEEEALAIERTWVAPQPLDAVAIPAGVQRRALEDDPDYDYFHNDDRGPAPEPAPPGRDPVDAIDLDVLAGKLYGRIRDDLRRELRVDRERSSRLMDGL